MNTDVQNNIRKELANMYDSGASKPLDDLYSLEATSLIIKDLDKKIAFYKEYKKRKASEISKEIEKVTAKRDFLKEVTVATLKANNEKSIKFPGVCSISTRNNSHKWVIEDEEEFIKQVEKALENNEAAEGVVQEVSEKQIVKKEADKLLNAWDANGRLEEISEEYGDQNSTFVTKVLPKTGVSFKFEKEVEQIEENNDALDLEIPKKQLQYDGIG